MKTTRLNISALATVAAGRTVFPNLIESVHARHVSRCMKAGLVVVDSSSVTLGCKTSNLKLTDAGIAAIAALGAR